jgi:hypothetical protein
MLKKGTRTEVFFEGSKLKEEVSNVKYIPHFSKKLDERI